MSFEDDIPVLSEQPDLDDILNEVSVCCTVYVSNGPCIYVDKHHRNRKYETLFIIIEALQHTKILYTKFYANLATTEASYNISWYPWYIYCSLYDSYTHVHIYIYNYIHCICCYDVSRMLAPCH